ncbi:family 43 glycosylhydrolase [Asticcacaulis sp. 201]|uniref:family 43 glycosylhydrolase n=1 Tax=Asticcacaulis sp. 201 TaxID=3028787 RepID=UPI002916F605|nr:family 43 glycosylhydrolase [Asticcacaulis sp. 201]MDV6330908.1 family 43 glycosylhydrolase [Asticcacaulis sp. 201]
MKTQYKVLAAVLGLGASLVASYAVAASPLVSDRFNADPSPHVFDGQVYLYATNDQDNSGKYWDSTDWRLISSSDLEHWRDEGSFLSVSVFKWASTTAKAWAPDVSERNGSYYFYAPIGGDRIGVAVSKSPKGPFTDARGTPLIDKARDVNVGDEPIDPAVLIDDDGQAYLMFGTRVPKIVKLKPNMIEMDGPIQDVKINGLPEGEKKVGYGEAPYLNKFGGLYYFTFSTGWPGQIVYATSKSPTGPYDYRGVVLDYLKISTNHQAIIDFHGKTWLFYHDKRLPGGGDYKRSITYTPLTIRSDGTIDQVVP